MRKTRTFLTRWLGAAVILLLLTALALGACGGTAPEPTTAPQPTEVAAQPTTAPTEPAPTDPPTEPPPTDVPTEPPPTEVPTEAPTEALTEPPPTATPTEEPTPEVVDDTACIACHTDQETLMAVAEEPEEAESLSEGEG